MTQSSNGSATARPLDRLKSEATDLIGAVGDRAVTSLRDKVEGATGHLTDITNGNASPGLKAALGGAKGLAEGKSPAKSMLGAGMTAIKEKVSSMFGKGGGGKGKKVTNIVESIDVGVPIKLAYNQWTQFTDFPSFMKKVESVEQAEDEKLNFKAQILWSHREWESTILEQQPDDKIVWRSTGAKGSVDGAVTFHELAPNLTRILVVLEYHPQGLFEHTGNLWRAQGRRVRLELKHFRRQVMTEALLHPDEVEGWRGEISDGEVGKQTDDKDDGGRQRQASGTKSSGTKSSATKSSATKSSATKSSATKSAASGGAKTQSGGSRGRAAKKAEDSGTARQQSSRSGGAQASKGRGSGSATRPRNSGSRSARTRSGGGSASTRTTSRQAAGSKTASSS